MNQSETIRRLERVLEINRQLNSSLELTSLLQTIIMAASELVDCQDCSILTLDESLPFLRFLAGSWFQFDLLKPLSVPLDGSIAGWVYTHGQAYTMQDVSQESLFFQGIDQSLNYQTRSLMAVPMVFNGQTIGVIEAVNKKNGLDFTSEDSTILETMAAQAAIALQNARLMEKAQLAYQQMVELDRMKTDFIAVTSHELRTPLGLILGHATFLRETATPETRDQLEVIVNSAMRIKAIVEDFTNIENYRTGMALLRSIPTDMQKLIQDVVDSFQPLARQYMISLKADTSHGAATLNLDPEKITAALSNLVKNAILFNNPGGHALVKADMFGEHLRISITDDGIGIPARDMKRLFERFFQVEAHLARRHGGMGLGLSIARDMVELHGGKISAESVEGRGSRFTILLPLQHSER